MSAISDSPGDDNGDNTKRTGDGDISGIDNKKKKIEENVPPFMVSTLDYLNINPTLAFFSDKKNNPHLVSATELITSVTNLIVENILKIPITRPPCWGKTLFLKVLYLFFSVVFNTKQYPYWFTHSIPLEVFTGKTSIVVNATKRIQFKETNKKEFELTEDRTQKKGKCICIILDFSRTLQFKDDVSLASDLKNIFEMALKPFREMIHQDKNLKEWMNSNEDQHWRKHFTMFYNCVKYIEANRPKDEVPGLHLYIDEIDALLIRVQKVVEDLIGPVTETARVILENCLQLEFTIVSVGIYPQFLCKIFDTDESEIYSIHDGELKPIFGYDLEDLACTDKDQLQYINEYANGFSYVGTKMYNPFMVSLAKNKKDRLSTYTIHMKSFQFIKLAVVNSPTAKHDCTTLATKRYKAVSSKPTEIDMLNSPWTSSMFFEMLEHAGFIVIKKKEEFPEWYFKLVDKEQLNDSDSYYIFPNKIMMNTFIHLIKLIDVAEEIEPPVIKLSSDQKTEIEELILGNELAIVTRLSGLFHSSSTYREDCYQNFIFGHYNSLSTEFM